MTTRPVFSGFVGRNQDYSDGNAWSVLSGVRVVLEVMAGGGKLSL